MNFNDLTIGQIKEIAAVAAALGLAPSVESEAPKSKASHLVGTKVIIRASAAGVHFGTLKSVDGDTVVLENSRRLWLWRVAGNKGISLSDVANHGVAGDSKICATIRVHTIIGACEVISTTDESQSSIEGAKVYAP